MPNNHLPTQTAVIKALGKLLGDGEAVFPAHLISSRPGFYVAKGLKNVSGPTILTVSSDKIAMVTMLADLLADKGFETVLDDEEAPTKITVNFIPREAR